MISYLWHDFWFEYIDLIAETETAVAVVAPHVNESGRRSQYFKFNIPDAIKL